MATAKATKTKPGAALKAEQEPDESERTGLNEFNTRMRAEALRRRVRQQLGWQRRVLNSTNSAIAQAQQALVEIGQEPLDLDALRAEIEAEG